MGITICNGVEPKDGRISPLGGTDKVSLRIFGFMGRMVRGAKPKGLPAGRSGSLVQNQNPDRTTTLGGNPLSSFHNTVTGMSIAPRTNGSVTGGDSALKIMSPFNDNVVISPTEKTVIKPAERLQTYKRANGPDPSTDTPFHPRKENRTPQLFPRPTAPTVAARVSLPSFRSDARLHSNGANDPIGSRWTHVKRGAAG